MIVSKEKIIGGVLCLSPSTITSQKQANIIFKKSKQIFTIPIEILYKVKKFKKILKYKILARFHKNKRQDAC